MGPDDGTPTAGGDPFADLRRELARFGPPIVVFNKSHSGSRVLAQLLLDQGVYLGSDINESNDSLDILAIFQSVVLQHYPDYQGLFRNPDPALVALIRERLLAHLSGFPGGRWGWKLCETTYILPLIAHLFPEAHYLHLVRDGRDVAFSNHVAPYTPLWRKVYFNTDRLSRWHGLPLSRGPYRVMPPLYNARHWANMVTIGRAFGSMMGRRYMEIRYEDLVLDFRAAAARVLAFLQITPDEAGLARLEATLRPAVGKYRRKSKFMLWLAMRELEPTLASFGYGPRGGGEQS